MRKSIVAAIAGLLVGFIANPLSAGEPPDLVPLTGPLPAPTPLTPPSFYRPNRWDVWQNLAVDRTGQFRPRVALMPAPYYLYNGAAYPFLPVKPLVFMPHVFD